MRARFFLLLCSQSFLLSIVHAGQVCDTSRFALSTPTQAFEDHGDGTVTDRRSGLQWMRCSVGQAWVGGGCAGTPEALSWRQVNDEAAKTNQSGVFFYNDWRLPNIRELATITERQCANPRINLELFPGTPASPFWTSVLKGVGSYEPQAFVIDFGAGGIAVAAQQDRRYARFVRTSF
jgi:hypothetical protein